MQERYAGDAGDYGKYGLARALCLPDSNGPMLKLGLLWWLVPGQDAEANDDGRHTSYVGATGSARQRYRACDPAVYDAMKGMIDRNDRTLEAVRAAGILPLGTVEFAEPLTYTDGHTGKRMRLKDRPDHRENWLERAWNTTAGCDIVLLDPDNGLECKTSRYAKRGPKYVYYDELAPLLSRQQSVVIYQHICRNGSALEQISGRRHELRKRLSVAGAIYTLLYHVGTCRAYFILPAARHEKLLRTRVDRLIGGPWGRNGLFERVC